MKLKVNDKVRIIAGKFKGLEGKITQVLKNKNRVIIGGINIVKVHQKPSQSNPDGGIFEKEASIHISNVSLPDQTKVKLVKNKDKAKAKKMVKEVETSKKVKPKTSDKKTEVKEVKPKETKKPKKVKTKEVKKPKPSSPKKPSTKETKSKEKK